MKIDAVLVIGAGVDQIVGESCHRGKLMSGLLIKVGIAEAAVGGAVSDAEIGEAGRVVDADRNVTRSIEHEVVDAAVPLPKHQRDDVTVAGGGNAEAVGPRHAE